MDLMEICPAGIFEAVDKQPRIINGELQQLCKRLFVDREKMKEEIANLEKELAESKEWGRKAHVHANLAVKASDRAARTIIVLKDAKKVLQEKYHQLTQKDNPAKVLELEEAVRMLQKGVTKKNQDLEEKCGQLGQQLSAKVLECNQLKTQVSQQTERISAQAIRIRDLDVPRPESDRYLQLVLHQLEQAVAQTLARLNPIPGPEQILEGRVGEAARAIQDEMAGRKKEQPQTPSAPRHIGLEID